MKKNKNGSPSVKCKAKNIFLTDGVLIDVYNALTRDFQRVRNVGNLPRISSIKGYRSIKLPPLSDVLDIDAYKCIYQLKSFFNRYTASDDMYSHDDRVSISQTKYETDLVQINTVPLREKAYLQPVIGRARGIIREILGEVEVEEIFGASRFGRRASIGVPLKESYIDNKMVPSMSRSQNGVEGLLNSAISGDPVLASYLEFYPVLRNAVEECRPAQRPEHRSRPHLMRPTQLRLSFVPKKFDKLRGVMPYPTGDTFLALGIGDVIVKRLDKAVGRKLAQLQAIHRHLVKRMSKDRRSVTMDLSGASDRITRWLVRLLLPSKWYALLKKFYFSRVMLPDGRVVHTETFAGMGCGFTFPLETLIFYSLLKAIGELVPVKGDISVYGDDCIFPAGMYPYVERIFPALGLKINRDKTFITRYFRESCGEDCYRGTSVRPFSPEGQTVELSGSNGAAYLYKILNGLLARWTCGEIPNTVEVLHRLIAMHSGSVLLVPPFQPDTAGYKVDDPDERLPWYIPATYPVKHWPKGAKGTPKWLLAQPSWLEPMFMYKGLRLRSPKRFVEYTYPYLWETLRSSSKNPTEVAWNPYQDPTDDPAILGYAIAEDSGKVEPYVAAKGPGQYIEQAIASQWIREDVTV